MAGRVTRRKTFIHVYYTVGGKIRLLAHTNGSLARRGRAIHIDGPSDLVTGRSPNKYGATTWIETYAPVKVTR